MVSKKGQEEMVGFVVIVLLVAIVFVIFLSIFLRGGSDNGQESKEAYQFVESLMEHTSECAISFEPDYSNIGELMSECYSGKKCVNGESTCEVLNRTLSDILDKSWNVGDESYIEGYSFSSKYVDNENEVEIVALEKGDCNGAVRGAEYLASSFPGSISSIFRICLN